MLRAAVLVAGLALMVHAALKLAAAVNAYYVRAIAEVL